MLPNARALQCTYKSDLCVFYATHYDTLDVRPNATVAHHVALGVMPVQMDSVVVEVAAAPLEAGVHRIDPEHLRELPTALRDGFRIIKSMPGSTCSYTASLCPASKAGSAIAIW